MSGKRLGFFTRLLPDGGDADAATLYSRSEEQFRWHTGELGGIVRAAADDHDTGRARQRLEQSVHQGEMAENSRRKSGCCASRPAVPAN
jgi:hypothetical protein